MAILCARQEPGDGYQQFIFACGFAQVDIASALIAAELVE